MRRIGATVALLGSFLAAGTGTALAATFTPISTTGASLTSGSYSWGGGLGSAGGFTYSGNLNDTAADGNAPFVHAKTDGYGYATRIYNNGGNGSSKSVSQLVYDTDGSRAQTAVIQVCRDRGTLTPITVRRSRSRAETRVHAGDGVVATRPHPPAMEWGNVLSAREVEFAYGVDPVLRGANLSVGAGESVALVGPSGAGKTSLLYCLAGLVVPLRGTVHLDDVELSAASEQDRARIRRECFGFVFQFAELVPELTLRENVELPVRLLGRSRRTARQAASELLERLGIAAVADHRPAQVSGGQAQRAAVARALVHNPRVVFADEPTGSLDEASGQQVLQEFLKLGVEFGTTVLVVTHDMQVARCLTRRIEVVDGVCRETSNA